MKEASLQTQIFQAIGSACLSLEAINALLDQPPSKVGRAVSGLVLRGFIERREKGCFATTELGLAQFERHGCVMRGAPNTAKTSRAPIRGTFRQRAWNVMRIQSPFTVSGIAALAVKDGIGSAQGLYKWFLALEAAGYIRREVRRSQPAAKGSNGLLRFRLVKNTGMSAPIYSAEHGCIRDPNLGKDVPCKR